MLPWLLLGSSLAGLAWSVVGWRRQVKASCDTGACDLVLSHPIGRTFGFPNSFLAIGYFLAMALFALDRSRPVPALPLWPALAASGASVLMSAYLAHALFFRLRRT